MTSRAQQETYELLHLVNDYDLLSAYARTTGLPVPAMVSYRRAQTGRAYHPAAWQVIRPGYRTDPAGHWRDGYHRTFPVVTATDKKSQLTAAQRWAEWRYYDGAAPGWARTTRLATRGTYHPAIVLQWLEESLAEARRAFNAD